MICGPFELLQGAVGKERITGGRGFWKITKEEERERQDD